MAVTTPNMGLKRWNLTSDLFSYTDLSNNWIAVDNHDHTSGKGIQIPTDGLANLAVTNSKLASAAVTDGKIATGTIADNKLASSPLAAWRVLMTWNGVLGPAQANAAGTYFADSTDHNFRRYTASSFMTLPVWRHVTDSGYAVAGKTTTLRLVCSWWTNGVAPGTSFSFGISSFTPSGTAPNVSFSLGTTELAGTIGTPTAAAGAVQQGTSAPISTLTTTLPWTGSLSSTGAMAAGSNIHATIRLEMSYT